MTYPQAREVYLWVLTPEYYTPDSVQVARRLLSQVTPDTVSSLLDEHDWRPQLVAGWFAGVKRWPAFTDRLGRLLIDSELCYQGGAFVFALTRFASDDAVQFLCDYLDKWLGRPECWYDKADVLAALQLLDGQRGTSFADLYVRQNGAWEQFVANKPNWDLLRTRAWLSASLDICDRDLSDP